MAAIKAGELFCDVPAVCKAAGRAGNVPAQSVVFMALAPVGVLRCYNPEAFSGGAEAESDDLLRARIMDSYASFLMARTRLFMKRRL